MYLLLIWIGFFYISVFHFNVSVHLYNLIILIILSFFYIFLFYFILFQF